MPTQKWLYDFPNLEPSHLSKNTFLKWFYGTCVVGGVLFAYLTVNELQTKNPWYSRPDLKPFPAMVPKEELDVTQRTALEAHYQSYRNKEY